MMIRFDNDHHGSFDAEVGAVHPITVTADAWRYVREVQDAGKPADATGYR